MNKLLLKISKLVKDRLLEFFLLVLILGIAAFFRFYKLEETFYFISDAGRDAQAIFKILIDHRLTLIGPRASVAGFFLGPFYFYFAALPFWLFKMDPLGLAYFASFLGVIGVLLTYLLGRKLFNVPIALFAAFIYGTSNIITSYSRMAWNPSSVPVFTLLLLLFMVYFQETRKLKWLILIWITLGLGIQLHYTFIYFFPPIIVYLYFVYRSFGQWIKNVILGLTLTLLLNSTLIIFDLRHNFLTSRAFLGFFISDKVSFDPITFFGNFWRHIQEVINLTILPGFFPFGKAILIMGLSLIIIFRKKQKARFILPLVFIFLSAIFFFSFFAETVQLYYYNFLLPFPILIISYTIFMLCKNKYLYFLPAPLILIFFWYNLPSNLNPPKPERSLREIKEITASIINQASPSASFNIASFSREPWYSAEEYRYFTYYFGKRANGADDYKNIQELYLVTSNPMEDPLGIKSQETADFGPTKVKTSWVVGSVTIFQLVR